MNCRAPALFAALAFGLGFGLASLCGGCATAPAAGTKCDSGVSYCASDSAMLACQSGTLTPYACTGPKGCTRDANRVDRCDQTGGQAGSACLPEYEGAGHCSADGASTVQCLRGTWTAVACQLGQYCHVDAGGVVCR